jgi:hypothetical protein
VGKDAKNYLFYTGYNPYSTLVNPLTASEIINISQFVGAPKNANSVAYGMLNTLDQQPKNVFRPDTYGQYRDMLEQPFDSIVYSLTGKRGPTTPPVVVTFVSASSESVVDPLLTNSNNLSEYATSSLPYFDGVNRSRSSTFLTASIGSYTPTTIVFKS